MEPPQVTRYNHMPLLWAAPPLVVPHVMLPDARALGFSAIASEPMPVWHGFSLYVDSSPQGNRHQRRSFDARRRLGREQV